MSRVTLKQVADRAKVSTATVSLVLNGRAAELSISDQCFHRVKQAAAELGYVSHYHARTLATGRSFTIGLAMGASPHDTLGNRLWSAVAEGVYRRARERGYDLLVIGAQPAAGSIGANVDVGPDQRDDPFSRGRHFLQIKRIDALITFGEPAFRGAGADAAGAGMPIAVLEPKDGSPLHGVRLDPAPGVSAAVRHLAELGHRDVLWVGRHERSADSWSISWPDRIAAYRRAVGEAGIVGREWFVAHDLPYFPQIDRHIEAYRSALAEGLRLEPTTTAIVCYNDTMALALYSVLADRGLRVPGDVSVIGFDDLHATYAIPPLTSISHVLPQMGSEAVDLVLESAEAGDGEAAPPRRRMVPAELVIRQSTGPAIR